MSIEKKTLSERMSLAWAEAAKTTLDMEYWRDLGLIYHMHATRKY